MPHYLKNADLTAALSEGDDAELWGMMHTLASHVAGRLKWFDDASREDAIQAVTIVLMSKRRKYRPNAGVAFSYFSTVAFNGFLQEIRNARRHDMGGLSILDEGTPSSAATRKRIRATP